MRPSRRERLDQPYDRYEPGPHHLAFHADSDAAVRIAFDATRAVGGETLDEPANYSGQTGYGEYYYAASFADPDGLKIEASFVPAANP